MKAAHIGNRRIIKASIPVSTGTLSIGALLLQYRSVPPCSITCILTITWLKLFWAYCVAYNGIVQDSPVTSAITDPSPGDEIEGPVNTILVKGYAWAGSGKGIIRVDVTADGGKSWVSADLKKVPQQWSR